MMSLVMKKIKFNKFLKDFFTLKRGSKDSFFNAIIGAISTKLNIKIDDVNKTNKTEVDIIKNLEKNLKHLRLNLCLSTFENQCYDINEILMEKNLFLRVYEKRNKFRYLIKKPPTEKIQL